MLTLGRGLFIAKDGKHFSDRGLCEEYERNLGDTYYFEVSHNPDLMNDGAFQSKKLLIIEGLRFFEAQLRVSDWVYNNIGSPVVFLKGVKPINSYEVSRLRVTGSGDSEVVERYTEEDVIKLGQFDSVLDWYRTNYTDVDK